VKLIVYGTKVPAKSKSLKPETKKKRIISHLEKGKNLKRQLSQTRYMQKPKKYIYFSLRNTPC